MCGITGIINFSENKSGLATKIESMTSTLYHRGPDFGAVSVSSNEVYALGHRRLSILDLTQSSNQPIVSSCSRYELVYNGEIYNFRNLIKRFHLDAEINSDTKLLVELISKIGFEDSLPLLNGMFAFALVDRVKSKLYLAKDRLGKKPLYYGVVGTDFVFASELKAIKVLPDFQSKISKTAVNLYFKYLNVPAPYSIFENIWKLNPGSFLEISLTREEKANPKKYWDLQALATSSEKMNREDWEGQLDYLLTDSVQSRMISDVPLGAFLSGGIDSSLIVSKMQELSSSSVRTFSIGTYDDRNEADDAKIIADHLGTNHTELYIDDSDALKLVDDLSEIWDEPFADSSQIPMLIVSQLAKNSVSVALSGDGGDEFFAGYRRYPAGLTLWESVDSKSNLYKNIIDRLAKSKSAESMLNLFDNFFKYEAGIFEQVKLWADIYRIDRKDDLYDFNLSSWNNLRNVLSADYILNVDSPRFSDRLSHIENMMLTDQLNYLPNDNLTKVDRASMQHSLEVRSPLLDYRIAELSWKIPENEKIVNGLGKVPLRDILYKYVPHDILDRPKRGFSVPVNQWILKDLKVWVDELLDPVKMKDDGILNYEYIARYWERIKHTNFVQSKKLWTIVMFQSWLRNQ